MQIILLAGKQAGCIGMLAILALGHHIRSAVVYDKYTEKQAALLGLNYFKSINNVPRYPDFFLSDLLICVHGREIVPTEVLEIPRYGAINVHPCLYAYKGADPIRRLMEDKNPMASVGVHRMTSKVDEGEVLTEYFRLVKDKTTEDEVYNALYPLYPIVISEALRRVCIS